MKEKNSYIVLLIILMFGAACMVGPKYESPNLGNNLELRNASGQDSGSLVKWIELYHDSALQDIIYRVLDSNRNILAATSRIEEARSIAGVVKANYLPRFDYNLQAGGGTAGKDAQKVAGGIDGAVFNAMGVFNWEIDLWGKLRKANRAAVNELLATEESRNGLKVSLIAEAASLYFLLRDLDNRLLIAERTLLARKENTRIISNRFDTGYVSELDKLQAVNQQAAAAALIPNLQRQIIQVENALRVLMGMGPGEIVRGRFNFERKSPATIPSGLSSQLLERRPDIREAEQKLRAQYERIGVAEANRLPSFSLTGLLGFASPQLSTFLGSSGFVANGFGGLTGPIFNFGQNKRLVEIEKRRTEQLAFGYQQRVLNAFAEVDNSLAAYHLFDEEHKQRQIQVEASRKAFVLSRARYDFGYTSYLEVIIQENALFDAELSESITLQQKLNSMVLLYKALGGGW
jgi:outer membrane protein, multidrug efflux system